MPSATRVRFWNGVNRLRMSSPSAIQAADADRQQRRARRSARPGARRTDARCAAARPGRLSEPAGMDVGDQDAAGAEVVELVHQPLGAVARDHRADGDPALAMQRRDGRGLDAGRQLDRGADRGRPGCRSPSSRRSARPGRPRAGAGTPRTRPAGPAPARVTSTASDSRITSPKISSPAWRSVLPVSTTSAITSATPSWIERLDGAVEPDDGGVDAVLLEVAAHHAGVRRGDPLAGQVLERWTRCRDGPRSGSATTRSRAPAPPRPWPRSRAAGRGR